MHIVDKLDKMADSLVSVVENLQELKRKESDLNGNIQELLSIALHYCNLIVTTKELAASHNLLPYKDDIMKQIRFIEEFIKLTEDLSFVVD
jgi:uncharacterized coiled-coil DUF342 family protein